MASIKLPPSLATPDPAIGLLPCPFCGTAARLKTVGFTHQALCGTCDGTCDCCGRIELDRDEAIAAWNRRAPALPEPTAEMVEAGAKYLAEEIMRYAWDGLLTDGRARDPSSLSATGSPPWQVGGHYNAGRQDYRDAALAIYRVMARAHGGQS